MQPQQARLRSLSSSSLLGVYRFFLFTWGTLLSRRLGERHCKHDFLAWWWQGCVFELLPGDSAEVDWGGPPETLSTEFVGLALLMEEYPEVTLSLPGSLVPQSRGSGPGVGGVWGPGTQVCRSWRSLSSGQASSSLDSWQQCCSGLR